MENLTEKLIDFEGRQILRIKDADGVLWLAKISLTPKMQKENSKAVEKLIAYQLKCAKVLHNTTFVLTDYKYILPTKSLLN